MATDATRICWSVGLIANRRSNFESPKSLRKSLKNRSVASIANLAASKLEKLFVKN
jgi:hypothetical protein